MAWADEWRFRDCPWCGLRDAELRILAGPNLEVKASQGTRWWAVVVCPRCGRPVMIEHNHPEYVVPEKGLVVPDRSQRTKIDNLPPEVERNFDEAIRVLDIGSPGLASVALRRALEAACRDVLDEEDRRGKTLNDQIDLLVQKQLVTAEVARALHHVRKVGNIGAHVTRQQVIEVHVSEEDARKAIHVTTQVFRSLFEIPGELAKL